VPDATSTDPVYPGATVLVGHLRGRQTKDAATLSGYKASGSQRLTMRAWMRDKDALVDKEDCLDAGIRFEGTEGDEGGEEEGGADVDVDVAGAGGGGHRAEEGGDEERKLSGGGGDGRGAGLPYQRPRSTGEVPH